MKRTIRSASIALTVAIGLVGIVPLAKAGVNDSTVFNLVKSAGAVS